MVVLRGGATLKLDDVVEFLRAHHIATHKLPEQLVILPSLPKTSSGKVAKAELRAAISQR